MSTRRHIEKAIKDQEAGADLILANAQVAALERIAKAAETIARWCEENWEVLGH